MRRRQAGHRVAVFGPPEVREHVAAAGFGLEVLEWPAQLGPRTPEDLMPRMLAAAVPWARQLAPRFAAGADLVIADCSVFGATMAARISGAACAAMLPTVYVADAADTGRADDTLRAAWGKALAGINRAREVLGLAAVASVTGQILDADRLVLLTGRAFELPDVTPPDHVRYVGPQLPAPVEPSPSPYPLPEGGAPLVPVSLSTTDQGQLGLLRRLLAALGTLPVRAVVTLGPVDPSGLRPPPNVTLERHVPHSVILPRAALVVTHAGHGTVMAAVSAGVPLVCVPMGRDQPAVATRVAAHGLGVEVPPDASADRLREAVSHVLSSPGFARATRAMARALEPADTVVREIEALSTARRAGPAPSLGGPHSSAVTGPGFVARSSISIHACGRATG